MFSSVLTSTNIADIMIATLGFFIARQLNVSKIILAVVAIAMIFLAPGNRLLEPIASVLLADTVASFLANKEAMILASA